MNWEVRRADAIEKAEIIEIPGARLTGQTRRRGGGGRWKSSCSSHARERETGSFWCNSTARGELQGKRLVLSSQSQWAGVLWLMIVGGIVICGSKANCFLFIILYFLFLIAIWWFANCNHKMDLLIYTIIEWKKEWPAGEGRSQGLER